MMPDVLSGDVMFWLWLSAAVMPVLGLLLRAVDIRRTGQREIDPKKITLLQALYSICFAWPFCALYAAVDLSFNP